MIKTTVLMKDISEFSAVNNIYSDFFSHHQPARAAFQVAALPKGGDIEIEAVAIIGEIKLLYCILTKSRALFYFRCRGCWICADE